MSESRPGPAEWWSKIRARAKTRGVAEAAGSLQDQLRAAIGSEGVLEFLVRDTAQDTPPDRDELAFREAGFGDADRYARQIGTDSPATFRARLTDTTSCYLVLQTEHIVHASWVTTAAAWTGEIRRLVGPPPGGAYVYESFTDPARRGRGIYPYALNCICAELATEGIGEAWIGVEATNVSSVRAITKAGFEPAFSVPFRKRFTTVTLGDIRGPRAEAAAEVLRTHPGH